MEVEKGLVCSDLSVNAYLFQMRAGNWQQGLLYKQFNQKTYKISAGTLNEIYHLINSQQGKN